MRDAGDEENADGAAGAEKERPKPVRGAFIVFEGMDRAGKTTQAKLLQQRCIEEGREVKFMRFPGKQCALSIALKLYLMPQGHCLQARSLTWWYRSHDTHWSND